jgi:hypothetical protein
MSYPNGKTLHPSDGNYTKSGKGCPVAVGSYPPNGFGLYDMQGNVVEWILDFYHPNYYSSSPSANPQGPSSGKFRVIRGGGWHSGPYCNGVYYRNALPPNWVDFNVGFRCAKDFNLKNARADHFPISQDKEATVMPRLRADKDVHCFRGRDVCTRRLVSGCNIASTRNIFCNPLKSHRACVYHT